MEPMNIDRQDHSDNQMFWENLLEQPQSEEDLQAETYIDTFMTMTTGEENEEEAFRESERRHQIRFVCDNNYSVPLPNVGYHVTPPNL